MTIAELIFTTVKDAVIAAQRKSPNENWSYILEYNSKLQAEVAQYLMDHYELYDPHKSVYIIYIANILIKVRPGCADSYKASVFRNGDYKLLDVK